MFKILVIQAQSDLLDVRAELLINDRLWFMRFPGMPLGDRVPAATTTRLLDVPSPSPRERLEKAGAIKRLFDQAARDPGCMAPRLRADSRAPQRMIGLRPIMAGQIVDASLVAAPGQRNTQDEQPDSRAGRTPRDCQKKPAKLRQKDRAASPPRPAGRAPSRHRLNGRRAMARTVMFTRARPAADGRKQLDLARPTFGDRNHVSIDRGHGPSRRWAVTDAATSPLRSPGRIRRMVGSRPLLVRDGSMRREGQPDKAGTTSSVRAHSTLPLERQRAVPGH